MKFEIVFYKKSNGKSPVKDFIWENDEATRAKIFRLIELLKDYGNELGLPYSKPLRDGIFELRIKSPTGISRILYFFYINKKAILTNAFTKKTQKTPIEEIEKALKYKKEFLATYKENSHE